MIESRGAVVGERARRIILYINYTHTRNNNPITPLVRALVCVTVDRRTRNLLRPATRQFNLPCACGSGG